MTIKGTPRITGIVVMEFSVDFMTNPAQVEAKAAFTDDENNTCGWTSTRHTSKETLEQIQKLRLCIERDLAGLYFSSTRDTATVPSLFGDTKVPLNDGDPAEEKDDGEGDAPGISEALGTTKQL